MAHHITSSRATDFPSIAPISDQPTEQRSVVAQGQTLFRRMQCWWLRLVGVLFRPTLPPMSALAGRPALRQALYRLPKEQRLALWSIDVEGLSHAEAAVLRGHVRGLKCCVLRAAYAVAAEASPVPTRASFIMWNM